MSKEMLSENDGRPIRCVVYARTATMPQADGSAEAQIVRCREFADRCGWNVLEKHIYADSGFSGLSSDRPALDKLMTDASSLRPFGCVLVVSADRLARALPRYFEIRRKLKTLGIYLFSIE